MRNWFLAIWCVLIPTMASAQRSEQARQLGVQGIALVDQGEYDEGIKLLSKARNAHPAEFDYPFEIGRAYMLAGKPAKAEKFLFPLQYHTAATAELYLLLARCYDSIKKPQQEEETYRYGIHRFPENGQLYHALASYFISKDSVAEGLGVCELGLRNAPAFADNYFLAARIMDSIDEALWAWWYGEMFLNLSDNSMMKREMAKQVIRNAERVLSEKWKPGADKFELTVAQVMPKCPSNITTHMIAMQSAIRNCFARHHSSNDPLTTMWREHERQGIMGLYVALILGEGDKDALLPWLAQHGPEYERFKQWFFWNGLKMNTPFTRHTLAP